MNLRKFRASFMMMALALLTALVLGGCGSDGYDDHTEQVLTKTETPLITSEQLKGWYDAGLVNSGDSGENVVILHLQKVDPEVGFVAQTLPGAYLWDSNTELGMTRLEGLGDASSSVITGEMMDNILQRSGVNRSSTIVLTGDIAWAPERAYFTLRYWGFPKERIKLLDGGVSGWGNSTAAENYPLTTARPPEHTSNNFSVGANGALRDDLRYSIGEMIQVVEANLDGTQEFNIVHRTDVTTDTGAITTPTIASAIVRNTGDLYSDGRFYKTADQIINDFILDLDATDSGTGDFVEGLPTITHCASGMSCAPVFFTLDAILGWPVAIYDGSTNQWTAYLDKAEGASGVAPNPAWNTTDLTNEAAGLTTTKDMIDPILNDRYLYVDDPRANQIEDEDADYMANPPAPPTSVSEGDASNC